jgi:hypothetical protein
MNLNDLAFQLKDFLASWFLSSDLTNIGARVYNSAAISVNNATATALTFNSERYDTDSIHSTSANTSRLTCTRAGKYVIVGHVAFASNATGLRTVSIRLNGSATIIAAQNAVPISGDETIFSIATIYDLAVGDYVELYAYQSSGGALNVTAPGPYSPEFAMHRLP